MNSVALSEGESTTEQEKLSVVSDLIFIRWIVDCVLFPESHGLISHRPLGRHFRSNLERIATLLMKMVNASTFGEEHLHYKELNRLLQSFEPKIWNFLRKVTHSDEPLSERFPHADEVKRDRSESERGRDIDDVHMHPLVVRPNTLFLLHSILAADGSHHGPELCSIRNELAASVGALTVLPPARSPAQQTTENTDSSNAQHASVSPPPPAAPTPQFSVIIENGATSPTKFPPAFVALDANVVFALDLGATSKVIEDEAAELFAVDFSRTIDEAAKRQPAAAADAARSKESDQRNDSHGEKKTSASSRSTNDDSQTEKKRPSSNSDSLSEREGDGAVDAEAAPKSSGPLQNLSPQNFREEFSALFELFSHAFEAMSTAEGARASFSKSLGRRASVHQVLQEESQRAYSAKDMANYTILCETTGQLRSKFDAESPFVRDDFSQFLALLSTCVDRKLAVLERSRIPFRLIECQSSIEIDLATSQAAKSAMLELVQRFQIRQVLDNALSKIFTFEEFLDKVDPAAPANRNSPEFHCAGPISLKHDRFICKNCARRIAHHRNGLVRFLNDHAIAAGAPVLETAAPALDFRVEHSPVATIVTDYVIETLAKKFWLRCTQEDSRFAAHLRFLNTCFRTFEDFEAFLERNLNNSAAVATSPGSGGSTSSAGPTIAAVRAAPNKSLVEIATSNLPTPTHAGATPRTHQDVSEKSSSSKMGDTDRPTKQTSTLQIRTLDFAIQSLSSIYSHQTIIGKLKCLEDARAVITAALTLYPDAGADEYMPLFCFVVMRANPLNLLSALQFIKVVDQQHRTHSQSKAYVDCCVAVKYLIKLNPDPSLLFEAHARTLESMGFSRAQIELAGNMVGRDDLDTMLDFLSVYRSLREIGYSQSVCVRAIRACKMNLEACVNYISTKGLDK